MLARSLYLLALSVVSGVQAATQTVTVGANGAKVSETRGLHFRANTDSKTYEPNNIKAAMGDIIK
jgi:hypothetical protein